MIGPITDYLMFLGWRFKNLKINGLSFKEND